MWGESKVLGTGFGALQDASFKDETDGMQYGDLQMTLRYNDRRRLTTAAEVCVAARRNI